MTQGGRRDAVQHRCGLGTAYGAVQENYPKIEKQKLLRALAHANEHLGQIIAYARVNGISPPWSK